MREHAMNHIAEEEEEGFHTSKHCLVSKATHERIWRQGGTEAEGPPT